MTAIAGFVHTDRSIWMASDTSGVSGHVKCDRGDTKVFQRGEFLFGFSGSFRLMQLVRYQLNVEDQSDNQSDHEYLCTTFIDALRKLLKRGGNSAILDSNKEESFGCFLVGYRGLLYCVEQDFQVGIPADGYDAVGSGSQVTRGALFATKDWTDPYARAYKAIEASMHHTTSVGGSIVVQKLL